MATLYSNELKAVLVPKDFLENPLSSVLKEDCLTVQHFDYQCEHRRNAVGEVYGPTDPVILKFSVRVNSPKHAKVFYDNLLTNNSHSYTILFNAVFNTNQRLSNYEDGMVVNGYVMSVEENYSSGKNRVGENEQMQLNVMVMARSVTYLGREKQSNYTSVFIQ
jgi:hypothetical protein